MLFFVSVVLFIVPYFRELGSVSVLGRDCRNPRAPQLGDDGRPSVEDARRREEQEKGTSESLLSPYQQTEVSPISIYLNQEIKTVWTYASGGGVEWWEFGKQSREGRI